MSLATRLLTAFSGGRSLCTVFLRCRSTLFFSFFAKQALLQVFNLRLQNQNILGSLLEFGFVKARLRLPIAGLGLELNVLCFGNRNSFERKRRAPTFLQANGR